MCNDHASALQAKFISATGGSLNSEKIPCVQMDLKPEYLEKLKGKERLWRLAGSAPNPGEPEKAQVRAVEEIYKIAINIKSNQEAIMTKDLKAKVEAGNVSFRQSQQVINFAR